MKQSTLSIIDELIIRDPSLSDSKTSLTLCISLLIDAYKSGSKLLVCGNGGSASDSLHIVGELMKDFAIPRPLDDVIKSKIDCAGEYGDYINSNLQCALPTIALVGSSALESAYANDRASDLCFAQQVMGLGGDGDILLAISTSGNSKNVLYAIQVARAKGLKVVGLTGKSGGKMKDVCDCIITVPETETYKIQEKHLPVYHCICLAVENEFFGR